MPKSTLPLDVIYRQTTGATTRQRFDDTQSALRSLQQANTPLHTVALQVVGATDLYYVVPSRHTRGLSLRLAEDVDTRGDELQQVADELSYKYGQFLHGCCHVFAQVLHEKYQLPLAGALEYDLDISDTALVHAWCQWSDGLVLDIRGLNLVEHVLSGFSQAGEPEYVTFKSAYLQQLGGKPTRAMRAHAKEAASQVHALAVQQQAAGWAAWQCWPSEMAAVAVESPILCMN